ncbi:head GIN domain-containing protein [Flavobacterium branchiophilum]|uniref:DUF2807 domain-containing protein n=1 Tax=Flavobacterium branchiophilum TaxID=55197 RepID=A0A2H3KPW3_9FLAO|nr:head GIN domain-containing protein [Flavobacterium branchiophilum]PDS26272.1 DUF2807 domain-containing protein [Flavobacterium branchiophilum]
MKVNTKFLIVSMFILTNVFGQNWGTKKIDFTKIIKTETRTTPQYEAIKISSFFETEIIKGTEGQIIITADEAILPYIITEVKNETLHISLENGIYIPYKYQNKIKILIPVESINSLQSSGSGTIFSKAILKLDIFKLALSGSGDIRLQLDSQQVEVQLSGSGNILLEGNCQDFIGKISGSGNIKTPLLTTQNATVAISGSGNINVNCTNALDAKISGSGNISYSGNPKQIESKVSGSGNIKQR